MASIAEPIKYNSIKYELSIGKSNTFDWSYVKLIDEGFLIYEPYTKNEYLNEYQSLEFEENKKYELKSTSCEEIKTKPRGNMTELELIDIMDKNKIGTDSSISVHIHCLSKRKYVVRNDDGTLAPTPLGMALIDAFSVVDKNFIKPEKRGEFESNIKEVECGKKTYEEVLNVVLNNYKEIFKKFGKKNDILLNEFLKYFKGRRGVISMNNE